MAKVINQEIIDIDGAIPAETFKTLDRTILNGVSGGRPTRAIITVHGPGIVYVNELGEDPVLATKNYTSYGKGGHIMVRGYDNMAAIKFAQLDSLKCKLKVTYEN